MAVDDGTLYPIYETLQRWVFADVGHKRARDLALNFDAFLREIRSQSPRKRGDAFDFHHFRFRPAGAKALAGCLADCLRQFNCDYDRVVGPLIRAGYLDPILTVIHPRYDCDLGVWDIHAHCVWAVKREPALDRACSRKQAMSSLDKIYAAISTHFSTEWKERRAIGNVGALVSYIAVAIDYVGMAGWPEEIIVELAQLSRFRLLRPAGLFADFRRKFAVSRKNGRIVAETRLPPSKRQQRRNGKPTEHTDEERQVASTIAWLNGEQRVCNVTKRLRPKKRIIAKTADPTPIALASAAINSTKPCAESFVVTFNTEDLVNSETQKLNPNSRNPTQELSPRNKLYGTAQKPSLGPTVRRSPRPAPAGPPPKYPQSILVLDRAKTALELPDKLLLPDIDLSRAIRDVLRHTGCTTAQAELSVVFAFVMELTADTNSLWAAWSDAFPKPPPPGPIYIDLFGDAANPDGSPSN